MLQEFPLSTFQLPKGDVIFKFTRIFDNKTETKFAPYNYVSDYQGKVRDALSLPISNRSLWIIVVRPSVWR